MSNKLKKRGTPSESTLEKMDAEMKSRFSEDFIGWLTADDTVFTISGDNRSFIPVGVDYNLKKDRIVLEDINSGEYFNLDDPNLLTRSDEVPMPSNEPEKPELELVQLKDVEFDPNIFKPHFTNTPVDEMFSLRGGIYPATNYICVGDPGTGKTTLLLDVIANIQKNDPDKKVLFISGEMDKIDMKDYMDRFPKFGEVPILFLGEYIDHDPVSIVEDVYDQGFDVILVDSFTEVQEAAKSYKGWTNNKAEKWLIDLMVKSNLGNNKEGKYTTNLMIQQMNKGGVFVGSNKLKHNTTGMMELKFSNEATGEAFISFSKNRRGCKHDKLYYRLGDPSDPEKVMEDVWFDEERLHREEELKKNVEEDRKRYAEQDQFFEDLLKPQNYEEAEQETQ